jgi:hypothetical protein
VCGVINNILIICDRHRSMLYSHVSCFMTLALLLLVGRSILRAAVSEIDHRAHWCTMLSLRYWGRMQRALLCQVQAEDQGCDPQDRAVGLHPGDGQDVRVHHGASHLPAHRCAVVVPLHLRVPDPATLQPGV